MEAVNAVRVRTLAAALTDFLLVCLVCFGGSYEVMLSRGRDVQTPHERAERLLFCSGMQRAERPLILIRREYMPAPWIDG